MKTLFVTGTGTEIGKTYVCCSLLRAWSADFRIRCIKPVITGFDPGNAAESDAGRLLEAQGLPVDSANIERTSPWRYRAAISADMAAQRENRPVPFDELLEYSRAEEDADLNLIEGIGGIMAPLDDRHTVLDWIVGLEASVLLVAGSYLGTLSHTLTAVSALRTAGTRIAAIAISQSEVEAVDIGETRTTLERMTGAIPVLVVSRAGEVTELAAELAIGLGLEKKAAGCQ